MTQDCSLVQLIAPPYAPPQMLRLARVCGCAAVGLRLLPASPGGFAYPLIDDAAMRRDRLAALVDTGVRVLDLEVVRLGVDFVVVEVLRFLEVGAQIGTPHGLVAGDDPDEARLTASFAALCDAAEPFKLTAALEFMPWTQLPNLRSAKRIVGAAARPNGGVLVDAPHFARSDSRLDELDDLPRAWLHYAQICDGAVPGHASVEGMIHDARSERLLPGEGDVALHELFAHLPHDLAVSIKVPSQTRALELGYDGWACRAVAATRAVLAQRHAQVVP